MGFEQFRAEYCDPRWPGTRSFLLRHKYGACIFLSKQPGKKEKLCSIHRFKPACCLDWMPGFEKAECQEGLQKVWKLKANSSRQTIMGTPIKLEEFRRFLGLAAHSSE
jgi:Fe-S-cluster containining protein